MRENAFLLSKLSSSLACVPTGRRRLAELRQLFLQVNTGALRPPVPCPHVYKRRRFHEFPCRIFLEEVFVARGLEEVVQHQAGNGDDLCLCVPGVMNQIGILDRNSDTVRRW